MEQAPSRVLFLDLQTTLFEHTTRTPKVSVDVADSWIRHSPKDLPFILPAPQQDMKLRPRATET